MSWPSSRFVLPQKGWLCFPVQGLEFERKSHQKVENSLERSSFAASAANSDLFYLLKLDHNPMWPMFYLLKLDWKCLVPNVPNALPPKIAPLCPLWPCRRGNLSVSLSLSEDNWFAHLSTFAHSFVIFFRKWVPVIPNLYTASNTCEEGDDNDDEKGACSPDHDDDRRGDDAEDDYHKDYAKGGWDDDDEYVRSACSPDDYDDVVVIMKREASPVPCVSVSRAPAWAAASNAAIMVMIDSGRSWSSLLSTSSRRMFCFGCFCFCFLLTMI